MRGVPARLTGAASRGLPVQSGPMMVTDLNHALGMGDDAPRPARRLTEHLTTIVRAATAAERAGEWWTSAIPCRRRPGRRACLGRIAILRDQPPVPIHWRCSNCTDEGTISNWEGSPYDLCRRGLSAVDEIHEVVVGDEIAASLRSPIASGWYSQRMLIPAAPPCMPALMISKCSWIPLPPSPITKATRVGVD